jgi:hypothetical protein
MKKITQFLFATVIIVTMLASCNSSKKGKWSKEDKNKFYSEIKSATSNLENLDASTKSKWIDLYFEKCQAKYTSFAVADADEEGCEKIALEVNDELLSNGSKRGNWSLEDKIKFRTAMENVKELDNFGENKQYFIECYLNKCEDKYDSYQEADNDEAGCKKIGEECAVLALMNK